jgi:hypothetical protein
LAGAAYAAVLLLVQWPYTVANNRVVWGPDVLLPAALPALLAGAGGALLGWFLGATLRPLDGLASTLLPARPAGTSSTPAPRGRTATGPLLAIGLAGAALLLFAVLPAAANGGAFPRLVSDVSSRQIVVGTLDFDPVVPVAGQPLTVRLTVTDPFLISSQSLIPFESVRAGDVVTGNFRAGTQPGLYQATFTPRQSGRRWLSAFLLVEEVRSAASASFVVYTPAGAVGQAPTGARTVVLRPEPGPDPAVPPWLQPVAFVALAGLLLGAVAGVAAALRAARGESVPGAAA